MSKITIRDGKKERDLKEITFEDLLKYHSAGALMALSVGFRVLEAGLKELFGDNPPERGEISILSGHAGPGFRDAFEYVTRAVTRGVYTVDVNYPKAQYDPHRAQSYAFVISSTNGSAVEVSLKDGFLPLEFYDYLAKGRAGILAEKEKDDFYTLVIELCEQARSLSQDELLFVERLS